MRIFSNKKSVKILFVSTEAVPFAKVGGLGSVMYSLPRALSELGHDARVMIPKYLSVDESVNKLKIDYRGLEVPTENENEPAHLICNVKRYDPENKNTDTVITYFLENQEYYE